MDLGLRKSPSTGEVEDCEATSVEFVVVIVVSETWLSSSPIVFAVVRANQSSRRLTKATCERGPLRLKRLWLKVVSGRALPTEWGATGECTAPPPS